MTHPTKNRARKKTVVRVLALSAGGALWLLAMSFADSPKSVRAASVTPLLSKDFSDVAGKELSMLTVEYAPGAEEPVHTHHAQAMVYVLEGSIVMQVKGGEPVRLAPGGTFYEGLDDVHIVGRNASSTKPARFVVFLVKDKDAPILVTE